MRTLSTNLCEWEENIIFTFNYTIKFFYTTNRTSQGIRHSDVPNSDDMKYYKTSLIGKKLKIDNFHNLTCIYFVY